MNNILVTGATGGLGRNAIEYLIKHGSQATATGRNSEKLAALASKGVTVRQADLTTSMLSELVEGKTAVWHCAALSSPWGKFQEFYSANLIASERLFHAAALSGVPTFVHISTPAVYFDYTHRYLVSEAWRAKKYANHYAATKALAESRLIELAQEHPGTRLVILRPRAIFGPHDQVLFPRLLGMLKKNSGLLYLPRAGRTVLDLSYTENVVHAMWLASKQPVPTCSIFNISNDAPISIAAALQSLVVDELGHPLRIKALPYALLAGMARGMEGIASLSGKEPQLTRYSLGTLAFDMTLDITKAKQLLGYVPQISMQKAFQRTAQWLRING